MQQIRRTRPCRFGLCLPYPFCLAKGFIPCHRLMRQKPLLQIQFNQTEDFAPLSGVKFLPPDRQANRIAEFVTMERGEWKRRSQSFHPGVRLAGTRV